MTETKKTNYLFIINDSPYGSERPYNALRLALNLVKRPDASVRVFLMRIPVKSSTESGHAVQWRREATLVREL